MPVRVRNLNIRRRKTYLREWREYTFPHKPLDVIAAKLNMSNAQLSRIERGISPYSQDFLEMAAKLYRTRPENLIAFHPGENHFLAQFRRASHNDRIELSQIAQKFFAERRR